MEMKCFDDTVGIVSALLLMSWILVEITLLPRIWVLLEATSIFLDHLILLNKA